VRFIFGKRKDGKPRFRFKLDTEDEKNLIGMISTNGYYFWNNEIVLSTNLIAKALGVTCYEFRPFVGETDTSWEILEEAGLDISKKDDRRELVRTVSNYLSRELEASKQTEEYGISLSSRVPEFDLIVDIDQPVYLSIGNKIFEGKLVKENTDLGTYIKRRVSNKVNCLKREVRSIILSIHEEYERKLEEVRSKLDRVLEFPDFTFEEAAKGLVIWRIKYASKNQIAVARRYKFKISKLIHNSRIYYLEDDWVEKIDAFVIFYLDKTRDGYRIEEVLCVRADEFFNARFSPIPHCNLNSEGSVCLGVNDPARGRIVRSMKELVPIFDHVIEILGTANNDDRYRSDLYWINVITEMISRGDYSFSKESHDLRTAWSV